METSNGEIQLVLDGVRSLGEARGWTEVTTLAEQISLANGDNKLLIAAAGELDSEFTTWLQSIIAPTLQLSTTSIDELGGDVRLALLADMVLAVFETGRLIEPEQVEGLASACFYGRPTSSYAVAMTRAEQIKDAEDLQLIESSAWSLLVPPTQERWNGQDLQASRIFFWSASKQPLFVTERLNRDMAALSNWLRDSSVDYIEHAAQMRCYRVLYLIDAAESAIMRGARRIPLSEESRTMQQLATARQAVSELHERVAERVMWVAESVERSIDSKLQTLEDSLIAGFRRYLIRNRKYLESHALDRDPRIVSTVLNKFIARYVALSPAVHEAEADINAIVGQYETDLIDEMRHRITGLDWAPINKVLARQHIASAAGDVYPKQLLALLPDLQTGPRATIRIAPNLPEGGGSAGQDTNSGIASDRVTRAITGGGIASLFLGFLGAGSLIAIPVGVAAGALIVVLDRRSGESNLATWEHYGKGIIHTALDEAHSRVREIRGRAREVRSQLVGELRQLEDKLVEASITTNPVPGADAISDGTAASTSSTAVAVDLKLLGDFRRRIESLK